jgi:outer membrane immunogenic protein
MKSHWLSATIVGVIAQLAAAGAFAADLPAAPAYAKAPMAPSAINWTGFYVGGDIGGAWINNTGTWNPLAPPALFGIFPNSGNNGGSGLIGGVLAGYNWQFAPAWVAGIEGDWSWAKAGGAFTQLWTGVAPPGPIAGSIVQMNSALDWVSSLRARVGYLVTPSLLAYATGGLALARIGYTGYSFAGGVLGSTGYSANISGTQLGFAVGGGLEWALTSNWLVRGEYLFYRFDHAGVVVAPVTTGLAAIGPQIPSTFSWSSTNVNVARMSLSYKF